MKLKFSSNLFYAHNQLTLKLSRDLLFMIPLHEVSLKEIVFLNISDE